LQGSKGRDEGSINGQRAKKHQTGGEATTKIENIKGIFAILITFFRSKEGIKRDKRTGGKKKGAIDL